MEVFKSANLTLSYSQDDQRLTQTWNGFATSESFRGGIDKTVEFVKANPVKTILSDTTKQKVVKPEDSNYAASKMPALFQAGLKGMAFVLPENIFTQMALKGFADSGRSDQVEYFSSVFEAKSWLDQF